MVDGLLQARRPLAVAAAIASVLAVGGADTAGARTLPVVFVPNAGQSDAHVRYLAHSGGSTGFFTDLGGTGAASGRVRKLPFRHANHTPRIVASRRAAGVVSYFRGGHARTGLPTYGAITY